MNIFKITKKNLFKPTKWHYKRAKWEGSALVYRSPSGITYILEIKTGGKDD